MEDNKQKSWNIASSISFLISVIMIYKGYNKMTQYSSSGENSYVGGDAYNYIINGNYSTGFFVLATLFAIVGIGFIIIGYLDRIKCIQIQNVNKISTNSFKVERIISAECGEELDSKINEKLSELKYNTVDSINITDSMNHGNKKEVYIIYH